MWGRLVICGRLAIGLSLGSFTGQADYQSAAGYQPAPQKATCGLGKKNVSISSSVK